MNLAAIAFLASAVVPAQPTAFETVNLRMTVDSCTFVPGTVRVTMSSNLIRVTQTLNNCFAPGTPQVADVQLGALPSGDYRVEVYATPQATGTPIEQLSFQVRDPVAAPSRPLTNYTGLWYNPQQSGWGLSLFQGATHVTFGLLFVYDGANRYTLSVPQPVPAKLFWSITVYDAETRSEIATDQNQAAIRSLYELADTPTDQPVVLHFGPEQPDGAEGRWIKTIPGKGWFVYFRIYGPEAAAFGGTWQLPDFERTT